MSAPHASLDAAAAERKARLAKLASLKRKQPSDDKPSSEETTVYLSGRNYDVETKGPKLGFETVPSAHVDTVEKQADRIAQSTAEQAAKDEAEADKGIDLFKLQPKKPNWDLKRELAERMKAVDVRTQNAIARLVRERIEKAKKEALASRPAATQAAARQEEQGEEVGIEGTALNQKVSQPPMQPTDQPPSEQPNIRTCYQRLAAATPYRPVFMAWVSASLRLYGLRLRGLVRGLPSVAEAGVRRWRLSSRLGLRLGDRWLPLRGTGRPRSLGLSKRRRLCLRWDGDRRCAEGEREADALENEWCRRLRPRSRDCDTLLAARARCRVGGDGDRLVDIVETEVPDDTDRDRDRDRLPEAGAEDGPEFASATPLLAAFSSGFALVNFGASLGLLNCCVLDGREAYGRSCSEDLHSYEKWPFWRHFWHVVDALAFGGPMPATLRYLFILCRHPRCQASQFGPERRGH
ncbi:hypothetical protein DV735_g2582, partial [Chaetothyriales sp. CBS 134920]